jgi:hypothetical protein
MDASKGGDAQIWSRRSEKSGGVFMDIPESLDV